ncbi:NADP-dependent isocitrate dehydrogenase, partial [Acinetobacter baumannii]|uniref:NADP-dependent isocitrate dehydrogenase n=1 Tax=Acinetobacter baumannii TaxID=470 RepID=UPI001138C195|nr:NADP-dependent isocitrate dehydrogenase [Acinetobacter baumannii]
ASADIAVEPATFPSPAHPRKLPEQLGTKAIPDHLAELGDLAVTPEANIIKLPNISASTPQLQAAIKELQAQGYALPDYPETVTTDAEKETRARYDKVKGSAVNPVLREGNSDRRAPKAVKEYAKANPHSMGKWSMASQTHVAHMTHGDFYAGEKSIILDRDCDARMEVVTPDGETHVLKTVPLQKGTVVDS